MKYHIDAVRSYFSAISFQVEADSRDEAEEKARSMIDNCEIEFDGIDNGDLEDTITVYPEP